MFEDPNLDMDRSAVESGDVRVFKPEQIKFDRKNYTLLLVINGEQLESDPLKNIAFVRGLQSKSEFHVTALGFKAGKVIKDALKKISEADRKTKEEEIEKILQETDWGFSMEPQSTFHIEKNYPDPKQPDGQERRESIIQMVQMPGLVSFYQRLNEILGVDLEAPPAHTILYTGGTNPATSKTGIGIDTSAAFNELHPERIEA